MDGGGNVEVYMYCKSQMYDTQWNPQNDYALQYAQEGYSFSHHLTGNGSKKHIDEVALQCYNMRLQIFQGNTKRATLPLDPDAQQVCFPTHSTASNVPLSIARQFFPPSNVMSEPDVPTAIAVFLLPGTHDTPERYPAGKLSEATHVLPPSCDQDETFTFPAGFS